jgi:hypothetical protein
MNERLPAAPAFVHELPLGACVLDLALGKLRGVDRLPLPLRPQVLDLLLLPSRRPVWQRGAPPECLPMNARID